MDWERSVLYTGAQPARGPPETRERGDEGAEQRQHIVGAPVRQLGFGAGPHAFIGIEVRCVAREIRQAEARMLLEEGPHDRPAVNVAVVPDDDDRSSEMSQEITQERTGVRRAEILAVQLEVEPAPPPCGTERQPGDHRDAVVFLPMAQDGSLAARRPGAPHGWNQEEARFVDEDEVGAQPRGVFFTRGHSRAVHSAIAASSRWRARRSGFCGVQPS